MALGGLGTLFYRSGTYSGDLNDAPNFSAVFISRTTGSTGNEPIHSSDIRGYLYTLGIESNKSQFYHEFHAEPNALYARSYRASSGGWQDWKKVTMS